MFINDFLLKTISEKCIGYYTTAVSGIKGPKGGIQNLNLKKKSSNFVAFFAIC